MNKLSLIRIIDAHKKLAVRELIQAISLIEGDEEPVAIYPDLPARLVAEIRTIPLAQDDDLIAAYDAIVFILYQDARENHTAAHPTTLPPALDSSNAPRSEHNHTTPPSQIRLRAGSSEDSYMGVHTHISLPSQPQQHHVRFAENENYDDRGESAPGTVFFDAEEGIFDYYGDGSQKLRLPWILSGPSRQSDTVDFTSTSQDVRALDVESAAALATPLRSRLVLNTGLFYSLYKKIFPAPIVEPSPPDTTNPAEVPSIRAVPTLSARDHSSGQTIPAAAEGYPWKEVEASALQRRQHQPNRYDMFTMIFLILVGNGALSLLSYWFDSCKMWNQGLVYLFESGMSSIFGMLFFYFEGWWHTTYIVTVPCVNILSMMCWHAGCAVVASRNPPSPPTPSHSELARRAREESARQEAERVALKREFEQAYVREMELKMNVIDLENGLDNGD